MAKDYRRGRAPATNCSVCDIVLNDDAGKRFGTKCEACQKAYLHEYHTSHRERHRELIKRNRDMKIALEGPQPKKPRKPRTQLSEEEKKARIKKRSTYSNFKQKITKYLKKHPEVFIRKPRRPNIDREIYEENSVWAIDDNYYLNIDDIMIVPLEHFTISHWETYYLNLSVEMSVYIQGKNYDKMLEDMSRWNCSYVKKDPEYGWKEDGTLRLYPT